MNADKKFEKHKEIVLFAIASVLIKHPDFKVPLQEAIKRGWKEAENSDVNFLLHQLFEKGDPSTEHEDDEDAEPTDEKPPAE